MNQGQFVEVGGYESLLGDKKGFADLIATRQAAMLEEEEDAEV